MVGGAVDKKSSVLADTETKTINVSYIINECTNTLRKDDSTILEGNSLLDENSLLENSLLENTLLEKVFIEKAFIEKAFKEKSFSDKTYLEKTILDKNIIGKAMIGKTMIEKVLIEKALIHTALIDKTLIDKTFLDKALIDKTLKDKSLVDKTLIDKETIDEKIIDNSNEKASLEKTEGESGETLSKNSSIILTSNGSSCDIDTCRLYVQLNSDNSPDSEDKSNGIKQNGNGNIHVICVEVHNECINENNHSNHIGEAETTCINVVNSVHVNGEGERDDFVHNGLVSNHFSYKKPSKKVSMLIHRHTL